MTHSVVARPSTAGGGRRGGGGGSGSGAGGGAGGVSDGDTWASADARWREFATALNRDLRGGGSSGGGARRGGGGGGDLGDGLDGASLLTHGASVVFAGSVVSALRRRREASVPGAPCPDAVRPPPP